MTKFYLTADQHDEYQERVANGEDPTEVLRSLRPDLVIADGADASYSGSFKAVEPPPPQPQGRPSVAAPPPQPQGRPSVAAPPPQPQGRGAHKYHTTANPPTTPTVTGPDPVKWVTYFLIGVAGVLAVGVVVLALMAGRVLGYPYMTWAFWITLLGSLVCLLLYADDGSTDLARVHDEKYGANHENERRKI